MAAIITTNPELTAHSTAPRLGWRSERWSLLIMLVSLALVLGACDDDLDGEPGGEDSDIVDDEGEGEDQVYDGPWTPRFNPEGDDFYRMPWPLDTRRQEDGRIFLEDFPTATRAGLVRDYRRELEAHARGFSTMPVVYFAFEDDQGPDADLFPSPDQTMESDSAVILVALDEDKCGDQTPIEVVSQDNDRDQYLPHQTMMAAPVPGFLLERDTTYAFIVHSSLSERLIRPEIMDSLLSDETPAANTDIHAAFEPLRSCWSSLGRSTDDIALATVFTTDDPIAETIALRAAVLDTEYTAAPTLTEWELGDEGLQSEEIWETWVGAYETPMFQRGDTPYSNSGGGLEFDEDSGMPIIQRWEEVPFAITVPDGEGPFPIVLWSDGTGADRTSHVGDNVFRGLIQAGYAVVAYDAQFHGERSERASPGADEDLSTFNYFNPEAGRTNFRQQLADTVYMLRVIRELLPTKIDGLDTDLIVYGGQSQGSLIGAMLAGIEDGIAAYAINGVGSYLSITVIERKSPLDIAAAIVSVLNIRGGGISRFHPVIQLVQLASDPVDPGNYARGYVGTEAHPDGIHMLTINGFKDGYVPYRCADSLAISGGLTPLAPAGWDLDPYGVWEQTPLDAPISGNATSLSGRDLTHATLMHPEQGHFTIYRVPEARAALHNFLIDVKDGRVPSLRIGE